MHSTSSEPITTHGKGRRPFLISKSSWLISILKSQECSPFCLDFPGKCLGRPENCSCFFFSFCPAVEDPSQTHNYFYLFQTICCAFNYRTAANRRTLPITHSNTPFVLHGVTTSSFLHTRRGAEKRTSCETILFLIIGKEKEKGTNPFSHL